MRRIIEVAVYSYVTCLLLWFYNAPWGCSDLRIPSLSAMQVYITEMRSQLNSQQQVLERLNVTLITKPDKDTLLLEVRKTVAKIFASLS